MDRSFCFLLLRRYINRCDYQSRPLQSFDWRFPNMTILWGFPNSGLWNQTIFNNLTSQAHNWIPYIDPFIFFWMEFLQNRKRRRKRTRKRRRRRIRKKKSYINETRNEFVVIPVAFPSDPWNQIWPCSVEVFQLFIHLYMVFWGGPLRFDMQEPIIKVLAVITLNNQIRSTDSIKMEILVIIIF